MEENNNVMNEYFASLMNPSQILVGLPDEAAQMTALRRLTCVTTFTVPTDVSDASYMFLWQPRGRRMQIMVLVKRASVWGLWGWLPFELDPVQYYRLFRVCSGILTIDQGTVSPNLAQFGGFTTAIQALGVPNITGISEPSELLQYRRTELGQLVQTPLFKGVRMLVPPDGETQFNQPDNLIVPTAPSDPAFATFFQPGANNASYFRTGQYTVQKQDEVLTIAVSGEDSGWTGFLLSDSSYTTIWSSGTSLAEFPPCVLGEVRVRAQLRISIACGSPTSIKFAIRLGCRVPRVHPVTYDMEENNFEYAEQGFMLPYTNSRPYLLDVDFRIRPSGPITGLLIDGRYHNVDGFPGASQVDVPVFGGLITGGAGYYNTGSQLQIDLMDMSTGSGFNSPNLLAIVSNIAPGQTITLSACANVEFVPNAELAPNVKVMPTRSDEDDLRLARLAIAVSPMYRGLYTAEEYGEVLTQLAQGAAMRSALINHALDWGAVWKGIKRAVGYVAPFATQLATSFNPALGQVVGGVANLIGNSRDSRALSRDSRALSKDLRVFTVSGRNKAAGVVLGSKQLFPCETELPDGDAASVWELIVVEGQPGQTVQVEVGDYGFTFNRQLPTDNFPSRQVQAILTYRKLPNKLLHVQITGPPGLPEIIDGHSWHASLLASLLKLPKRLWTGSPLVPPGALPIKTEAARVIKSSLLMLNVDGALALQEGVRERVSYPCDPNVAESGLVALGNPFDASELISMLKRVSGVTRDGKPTNAAAAPPKSRTPAATLPYPVVNKTVTWKMGGVAEANEAWRSALKTTLIKPKNWEWMTKVLSGTKISNQDQTGLEKIYKKFHLENK